MISIAVPPSISVIRLLGRLNFLLDQLLALVHETPVV
jgi:hypothetical protein